VIAKRVAWAAGLTLAVATAAAAKEERPKWWQSERVKAEIGLSDEQSQEIEGVFQAMLPRLRADKADLDREERALSTLLKEAAVDEPAIVEVIDRVEAARARASKSRTIMLYRMYRVLTPEQRIKLDAIHQRLRGERRGPSGERPH
jgi:Spy/CpxP family protein refolding chaperone